MGLLLLFLHRPTFQHFELARRGGEAHPVGVFQSHFSDRHQLSQTGPIGTDEIVMCLEIFIPDFYDKRLLDIAMAQSVDVHGTRPPSRIEVIVDGLAFVHNDPATTAVLLGLLFHFLDFLAALIFLLLERIIVEARWYVGNIMMAS